MKEPNKHISDLRKKAEIIFTKENIHLSEESEKQWISLLEELGVYHIELEQQNKELQELQLESELQKKEFENLYQNAPNAYFELNNKLEVLKCNKSALNLLQITRDEIYLKKFNQFVAPSQQDLFYKTIQHVKNNNKTTYATTLRDFEKVSKHVILKIELNILNKSQIRISATDISNEEKLIKANSLKENILDNVNDCIFTTDTNGTITFWGNGAERILGYSEKEMLNTSAQNLFRLNNDDFANFVKKASVIEKYVPVEIKLTDKNGNVIFFNVNISKSKALEYSEASYIYVCQDITYQKETENNLKKAKEQTEIILNSINQQVYITDPDSMNVLFANAPMREDFRHIQNTNCYKAIFNKSKPCEFCNVKELRKSNSLKEINTEVYLENLDRWYKIHEKKIPWVDSKHAIVHTFTDISEIKKAEKEQNKLIDQLNYLSTSATKFISLKTFDEIYRYLGKSLSRALEGSMVVVGEFKNDDFTIIDFFGLDVEFIKQFEKITGSKGLNSTFKPDKKRLELYRSGHLESIGDLNNMFLNYFNDEAREQICSLANIKDTRIIGVTYHKKLFAGIAIMLTKPLDTIDIEFTQALVYQASIAIQRKNHENKLLKTLDEAEAANKAKSAFLTNISHEIRTPLNTIIGFTEILNNLNEDPLKESYINAITTSGKNLLTIINDILDLSKIESGTMQINKMAISIKTLFDDIEYTFRKAAEKKNLEFVLRIDKNVPDIIQMDQPRLRQVIHNLVSNAIKFTIEGKVSINATANKTNNGYTIIFEVKDTGIGIKQEQIESILQPFSQADSRDARKYEGTGMGLSIAKKITEMLGGNLIIKSEKDKGSLFRVTLENVISTQDNATKNVKKTFQFNKEKVLIIEEDMSQLEIIQSVIDKHNLVAFIAETGEQGFAFAFEFAPDFIIINLTYDKESAIKTARNIKSLDQFKNLPIIAITNDPVKHKKHYNCFDGIITLPVTEEKLVDILSKFALNQKEKNKDDDEKEKYNFIINDLKILNEIYKELEKNVTPLCEELKHRQPLNKVKELNKRLKYISQKYESTILETYCKKIDNSIKSFDIINMRELINDYSKLKESLKNKINKQ